MELEIEGIDRISHEIISVGLEKKVEFVDIARDEDGELLSINVGPVEISPETWEILLFLKREGKL